MVIEDFIPFRAAKICNGISRAITFNKGKFICAPAACQRIFTLKPTAIKLIISITAIAA